MISDAIIRTITRWLPTLDEARLRRVEAKVLEEALAQQDEQFSAPADTVVHRDGERTHGGNLSAAGRHGAQRDAVTPPDRGHETPTGGDYQMLDRDANGDLHWRDVRLTTGDRAINAGLRELRDATPEPGLNSASMWQPEVDGRFDDGGES